MVQESEAKRFSLRAALQRESLPGRVEISGSSPVPPHFSTDAASLKSDERTAGGRENETFTTTLGSNYKLPQEKENRLLSRVRCFSTALKRQKNKAQQPESLFDMSHC